MGAVAVILQTAPSAGQVNEQSAEPSREQRQPHEELEEITVTARKRQESLLNVPVTESVVTQESLEQFATNDLYTLASRVPGLVLGDQLGVFGPAISLRGMGTTVEDPAVDQEVSLNVDGLQLSQAFAMQSALFDVGQVEVLKGPQALFFGKNSPAGVISLRSADPTDRTELEVRGGYETEAQAKLAEAVISGPVTPALKLRLAAHYSTDNGYFDNLDTAPAGFGVRTPTTSAYGADENWILRGTALFDPSELYDARLKINFSHDLRNYGGGQQQLANCPGGLTSFTSLPVFDPNEDCQLNKNIYISWFDPKSWPYVGHDGIPFVGADQGFGTLEQNLHLPAFTVTAVTGYYEYHQEALQNGSDTSGLMTIGVDNDFSNRELTQELRLSSGFKGPLNFMVGGFYQDGGLMNHPRIYLNETLGLPPIAGDVIHHVDIQSTSAFGQVTWDIFDKLELAGGARWTDETRNHEQYNVRTPGVPVGPTVLLDPHLHATNTSPEVTLTYRPTDDLTFWAAYKQGFKSGSFDTAVYYSPTTPTSYRDEAVAGTEGGIKARMLDRHLTVNLSAYLYHYRDLQVSADQSTAQTIGQVTILNAATAKLSGVDFDANYVLPQVRGLSLNAALNWNVARYGNFPNAPCMNNQTIADGCNQLFNAATGAYTAQDLSGQPLVRAPRWTGDAGWNYDVPVGRDLTLTFGGSVSYSSWYYTNLLDLPRDPSDRVSAGSDFIQGSYYKANANVAIKGSNDAWELAVIGSDLNNKITASACTNADMNGATVFGGQVSGKAQGGPAGDDYAICSAEPGRAVWLRVTVRPFNFDRHD
jgi:iron complex outermembrane receptor protein